MNSPTSSGPTATAATGEKDAQLFDGEQLNRLAHWTEIEAQLAARGLAARPLRVDDYENGYLELLSQLTTVGPISKSQFEQRFRQMKLVNQLEDHYAIVVIEDVTTKKLVGTTTLFMEFKFIHTCAVLGRLEDVAVLDTHRGRQVGELVVRIIVGLAKEVYRCYKIVLSCKDELKNFYAKNGFVYSDNMLCIRF